jgi:hypothetical protein
MEEGEGTLPEQEGEAGEAEDDERRGGRGRSGVAAQAW